MTTTDLDLAAQARRLRTRALAVLDDMLDAVDDATEPPIDVGLEAVREAMRAIPPRPVVYVHPTRLAEVEQVVAVLGASALASRFVPVDRLVVDRRPTDRISADG